MSPAQAQVDTMTLLRGESTRRFTEFQQDALYKRVIWRVMPLLLMCYGFSFIDRINVSFAKLQMASELGLSDAVYGLGAGIFFIGYFLMELPSNLILERVGARIWIARIMITWGLISAAMMFVQSAASFYALRFLLGAAEAGFFPGIILYLTYWFPSARRTKVLAAFFVCLPIAFTVAGPVSGYIMTGLHGVWGYSGWQWMFVAEALPTLVLGVLVWRYLDSRIEDAKWLSPEEKAVLQHNIAQDCAARTQMPLMRVLADPRLWVFCLMYLGFQFGGVVVSFFSPQLIKESGVSDIARIGLLSGGLGLATIVATILIAHSSVRLREQRMHVVVLGAVGAAALLGCAWLRHSAMPNQTIPMWVLLAITAGTLTGYLPVMWSLITERFPGSAAAASIAIINAVSNLAGFTGPTMIGAIKSSTGSMAGGVALCALFVALASLLMAFAGRPEFLRKNQE
ncbi:MFS transporter [Cupriavidus sp. TMH.W2]|uniref:MFS transporter n=1 Tax=Cupriavidus sp. TMH.W2 TaxID=3434465 RepID=UPI003D782187